MSLDYKAKVISFNGYGPESYEGTGTSGVDDPTYVRKILCEGDSWFSTGAVPSSNLLYAMRFRQSSLLVNLARPGDTIRNMSDISANPVLKQLICQQNFLRKWDAILLSGGGNDLIDLARQIICVPSAGAGRHMLDYIDSVELNNLRRRVQKGYHDIARLREASPNADTPIVTHVYDYPTPRNAKARFAGVAVNGPWIYAALKTNDVPEEFWISLTDYMFEYLANCIIDLSGDIDNFHVVSATRGTLVRARLGTTGADGDWLNEIHPTAEGYEKIASIISGEFAHIVP